MDSVFKELVTQQTQQDPSSTASSPSVQAPQRKGKQDGRKGRGLFKVADPLDWRDRHQQIIQQHWGVGWCALTAAFNASISGKLRLLTHSHYSVVPVIGLGIFSQCGSILSSSFIFVLYSRTPLWLLTCSIMWKLTWNAQLCLCIIGCGNDCCNEMLIYSTISIFSVSFSKCHKSIHEHISTLLQMSVYHNKMEAQSW